MKRGLKFGRLGAMGGQDAGVKEDSPMKRGLKLDHSRYRPCQVRVKEDSPMKRGLKCTRRSWAHLRARVKEDSPMKRGLK